MDWKNILDNSPIGHVLISKKVDFQYQFLYANSALERWTGYSPEDIIGKNLEEIPGFLDSELLSILNIVSKSKMPIEKEHFHLSTQLWLQFQFTPLEEEIILSINGIHKFHKHLEEFDLFFALSSELFCIVDQEGRFIKCNSGWEKILGYTAEELLTRDIDLFIHKEDRVSFENLIEWEKSKINIKIVINRFRSKDGNYKYLEWKFLPKGSYIYGCARDITEKIEQSQKQKKYLDEILFANKEINNYKNAIDQVAIISITNTLGDIIYINENFCNISGYSKDELIGKNHRIINSGTHSTSFFRNLWSTIKSGRVWKGEVRNKKKFGGFYWVDTTIIPFLDENGNPERFISIQYDVTARKENEENLLKTTALLNEAQEIANIGTWEYEIANNKFYCSGVTKKIYGIHTNSQLTLEDLVD
jgi:PAS domain S-box-containing protein